jgi:hypothetical protein
MAKVYRTKASGFERVDDVLLKGLSSDCHHIGVLRKRHGSGESPSLQIMMRVLPRPEIDIRRDGEVTLADLLLALKFRASAS